MKDITMRLKHIIEGGSKLIMCLRWVQKLRTFKLGHFQSVLIRRKESVSGTSGRANRNS